MPNSPEKTCSQCATCLPLIQRILNGASLGYQYSQTGEMINDGVADIASVLRLPLGHRKCGQPYFEDGEICVAPELFTPKGH